MSPEITVLKDFAEDLPALAARAFAVAVAANAIREAEEKARRDHELANHLIQQARTILQIDLPHDVGPVVEIGDVRLYVHMRSYETSGVYPGKNPDLKATRRCSKCGEWALTPRRLFALADLGQYLQEPHDCAGEAQKREAQAEGFE